MERILIWEDADRDGTAGKATLNEKRRLILTGIFTAQQQRLLLSANSMEPIRSMAKANIEQMKEGPCALMRYPVTQDRLHLPWSYKIFPGALA